MRIDEDARFRMMRQIAANPGVSQRGLARELGVSLGAANYCLKALVERGMVKMERFRASENKVGYIYVLTPRGFSEKARLTRAFLSRKVAEYERLREEISSIEQELHDDGTASPEPR